MSNRFYATVWAIVLGWPVVLVLIGLLYFRSKRKR